MAWNPSKEVAVARDAAKALDDASMCIVVWISSDAEQIGVASFGKTRKLCGIARELADRCHKSVMEWGEDA